MAGLAETGLNKKIHDSATIAKEADALDGEIAELRNAYEQFFLGIERKPPTLEHTALKKKILKLKGAFVRQTALKFRINALQQKLISYERLWARTLQEIEAGTYRRDLVKAKLHEREKKEREEKAKKKAEAEANTPAASSLEAAFNANAEPKPAPALAKPPPAKPVAAKPASGPSPDGLSDTKLKAVYDAYITAKKRCQEDTSKMSFESVAATLRKQVPALIKQSGARTVEFKILIKDGKAVLRAIPK